MFLNIIYFIKNKSKTNKKHTTKKNPKQITFDKS